MAAPDDEASEVTGEPAAKAAADAPDVVGLDDVELLGDEAAEWIERGRELYIAGDLSRAAAAFAEAARLDPDSYDAIYLLAKALRGVDPAAARALFERAVALRPESFEGWRALALQCAAMRDPDAAERALAGARATGDGRCDALRYDVAAVF